MSNTILVRLPAQLKLESTDYAKGLGISMNAFVAVAMREYLDRRRGLDVVADPAPETQSAPGAVPEPKAPVPRVSAKATRAAQVDAAWQAGVKQMDADIDDEAAELAAERALERQKQAAHIAEQQAALRAQLQQRRLAAATIP